eukprot:gene64936-88835_t
MDDEFLKPPAEQEFVGERASRMGAINMALLFGTAVIALALIVTPLISAKTESMEANSLGYDDIKTGSIPIHDGKVRHYTIRRSILQADPGEGVVLGAVRHRTVPIGLDRLQRIVEPHPGRSGFQRLLLAFMRRPAGQEDDRKRRPHPAVRIRIALGVEFGRLEKKRPGDRTPRPSGQGIGLAKRPEVGHQPEQGIIAD